MTRAPRWLARRARPDVGALPVTARAWQRRLATRADLSPEDLRQALAWFEAVPSADHALRGGEPVLSWLRSCLRPVEPESLEALLSRRDLSTSEGRAAAWRDYIARTHAPAERVLLRTLRFFLRRQAARLAKRIPDLVAAAAGKGHPGSVVRIDEDTVQVILNRAVEEEMLRRSARPGIRAAIRAAIKRALEALAIEALEIGAEVVDDLVIAQLGRMVKQVTDTTIAVVQRVVEQGLASGATVTEMQAVLMEDAGFAAPRALRIARTETNRAVSAGTQRTYEAAVEAGARVKKMWLSARDGAVRETHQPSGGMDGQIVGVDEDFVSPSGARGPGPGLMGDPAEDVNCRCGLSPVVIARPAPSAG